jgi:hypothetical protein
MKLFVILKYDSFGLRKYVLGWQIHLLYIIIIYYYSRCMYLRCNVIHTYHLIIVYIEKIRIFWLLHIDLFLLILSEKFSTVTNYVADHLCGFL